MASSCPYIATRRKRGQTIAPHARELRGPGIHGAEAASAILTFRNGCLLQYVSDRHSHSSGPNWKYRIQIDDRISCTIQIATTI